MASLALFLVRKRVYTIVYSFFESKNCGGSKVNKPCGLVTSGRVQDFIGRGQMEQVRMEGWNLAMINSIKRSENGQIKDYLFITIYDTCNIFYGSFLGKYYFIMHLITFHFAVVSEKVFLVLFQYVCKLQYFACTMHRILFNFSFFIFK